MDKYEYEYELLSERTVVPFVEPLFSNCARNSKDESGTSQTLYNVRDTTFAYNSIFDIV